MTTTSIEWAEHVWNPIVGCSKPPKNQGGAGCANCYAERMAARLARMPQMAELYGPTVFTSGRWTGRVILNEKALTVPLKRKKPTVYFVNSMGDLFHENCPDEWIDRVFAVMALCPQHRFIFLTKRAERMREYFLSIASRLAADPGQVHPWCQPVIEKKIVNTLSTGQISDFVDRCLDLVLPNVVLGVSVATQADAALQIWHLLNTPAACRIVSVEPMLEAIRLAAIDTVADINSAWLDALGGEVRVKGNCGQASSTFKIRPLDGVICGGESGPGARPMHPDWARSLRDQCAAAGVTYFLKQWGEWLPGEFGATAPDIEFQNGSLFDANLLPDFDNPEASKGWHDGLDMVADNHRHVIFRRVGKKKAGRLLDGVEHNALPPLLADLATPSKPARGAA